MKLLLIENQGQQIANTNYWQLEHAQKGLFYLSWNAGAARLLVPESQLDSIEEMTTCEYVIISRGKFEGRDALELLFEDNTDTPFSIHIVTEQTDRLIPEYQQGGGFVVTIWTQAGQKLKFDGKYRVVDTLPDFSPWVSQ